MKALFLFAIISLISCGHTSVNIDKDVSERKSNVSKGDTLYSNEYNLISFHDDQFNYLLFTKGIKKDTLIKSELYHCENVFGELIGASNDFFVWANGTCGSGNRDVFFTYNSKGKCVFREEGLIHYFQDKNYLVYTSMTSPNVLYLRNMHSQCNIDSIKIEDKYFFDFDYLRVSEKNKEFDVFYEDISLGSLNG